MWFKGNRPSKDNLYDPVFLNSRREAIVIASVWVLGLIWAVPYCYLTGYNLAPEEVQTIVGIPSWIFWGIGVPWVIADLFTAWFCFLYMSEDDLEEDLAESEISDFERIGT